MNSKGKAYKGSPQRLKKVNSKSGPKRSKSKERGPNSYHAPLATSTPLQKSSNSTEPEPEPPEPEPLLQIEDRSSIQPIDTSASTQIWAADYKPLPYIFRIPNNSAPLTEKRSLAKCPPFYIQVDHALAVVWSLYSKELTDRPIGVVQLQWALNFLKGIRNKKGEYPKDIGVCVEAMEEALMNQYAALVDTVKPKSSEDSSLSSIKNSSSIFRTKTIYSDTKYKQAGPMARNLPFSVNYSEMSKRTPNNVQQLFKAKTGRCTDVDIRQLVNLKHVVSSANSQFTLDPSVSRDNMVGFLKGWRKEQIGKIQEELKRLHSIETFIGTMDSENFKPYLDNQQLDVLAAQQEKNGQESSKSILMLPPSSSTKKHSHHKSAR